MDASTQMIEFSQFGLINGSANAERARSSIGAKLLICLACQQGDVHAALQRDASLQSHCTPSRQVNRILADRRLAS
jgi:hypothetical protein